MNTFLHVKLCCVLNKNYVGANSVVRSGVYAKVSVILVAGCSEVNEACVRTSLEEMLTSFVGICSCRHAQRPPGACRCGDSLFPMFSCLSWTRLRLSALETFWKSGSCKVAFCWSHIHSRNVRTLWPCIFCRLLSTPCPPPSIYLFWSWNLPKISRQTCPFAMAILSLTKPPF